jgi:signal transduction histidine kinase/DNA-binding response OmpR family regulator
MSTALLTVAIQYEQDVVVSRQRARQISGLLGFDGQDQTRIATAVSEIARNAYRYAGGGKVEFALEGESTPQVLHVRISDKGPGISDIAHVLSGRYRSSTGMGIGLIGAHRLMDRVEVRTSTAPADRGTDISLRKILPHRAPLITTKDVGRIVHELTMRPPVGANEELQQQNQELLRALSDLRERQDELQRLNRELEDTNRGVVALYAELDEKADHLRRADDMKSKFLSNMSHEFRTPLNSIRALSRLLLDRVDGELNEEQVKQVGFIAKAAGDLTELVNDLLDLAKIEAGKTEVRPVEFAVANLFSALRGMLRPLLVSEDVKLVFEEPDPSLVMYNDEGKVSQILRNFISNAIKFTERGEVRVYAHAKAGGAVALSVTDTGVGIREEHLGIIFDEFTQVPNPMQGRVKGTGLGLPLCRRLARLMQGEVTVRSEIGVGSTFTATLPLHFEERPSVTGTLDDVEIDPLLVPVLIVEDQPETQFIYEKLLKGTRYQPLSARNLREAREIVKRAPPQAVLLDILLKGEDTWRWLADLKHDPATANIPVLVATNVEDERKALALGADGYCRKPLSRATLLEQLAATVARNVLVIDDDPAARYLYQKLLTDRRTHVIEAEDAHSGLAAARSSQPAMIFLDLSLPDGTGEDVLAALRRDKTLKQVPVAVVTSRVLSQAERERLGERAQAVLEKSELSADRARELLSQAGL